MGNKCYELTEEQWNRVKDFIYRTKMGRLPKDNRFMLNAILWLARRGIGWQDLSERYDPWKIVYNRFCKWCDNGTFMRIFQELNKDADMENLSSSKHTGVKKVCK